MTGMPSVAANIEAVKAKIAAAARESGRDPSCVRLVAVTKTQPEAAVAEALAAGQRLFGENRVQEAKARWQARRAAAPDLELHLIGPLQTNKVKDAVALFDVIETVDRPKLAQALAAEMKKQGKAVRCLVQVNTGDEPQKSGVAPQDLPALLAACAACGLPVYGLMAVPPADDPPALHFALLKKLAARHGLADLSMGMSGDYETAIALGATHVRVGAALFGARLPA